MRARREGGRAVSKTQKHAFSNIRLFECLNASTPGWQVGTKTASRRRGSTATTSRCSERQQGQGQRRRRQGQGQRQMLLQ